MASKASQTKFIKEKYLASAIFIVTFFNLILPTLLLFIIPIQNQPLLITCTLSTEPVFFNPVIFSVVFDAVLVGLGLYFDIKMLIFIKQRNMVQPVELIPWKSFNASSNIEERKVPLRATIISTVLMVIPSTISFTLIGKFDFDVS